MVRVLLDKIPPGVIQKELRGKRSLNRKVDGTFDLGKRIDKKRARDDKCQFTCGSKHLVALWFSTLDLIWEKGRKQGLNPSLKDAIYEDFKTRGIAVDETSWVAYQVTAYTS